VIANLRLGELGNRILSESICWGKGKAHARNKQYYNRIARLRESGKCRIMATIAHSDLTPGKIRRKLGLEVVKLTSDSESSKKASMRSASTSSMIAFEVKENSSSLFSQISCQLLRP